MKKIDSCFVVSPIGKRSSAIRRHADQVLKHIISPVLNQLGISVERSDRIEQAGRITDQILERILSADLVIADLSKHNPNVFYELAIRHVLRRPCIHLVSGSDEIPFDVRSLRAIAFDLQDPDSIAEAKESLEKQIQNAARKRMSPLGKEFEEQLGKQILSRGLEHFAHISVTLPEIPDHPRLSGSSMDTFQALSADDGSLVLLKQQLAVHLERVNAAIEARLQQSSNGG